MWSSTLSYRTIILCCKQGSQSELFSNFFSEKIDKLLSDLQCFNTIDRPTDEKRCFTDCIHVLDPTINADITEIYGTTDKTCVLDPLPVIS